MNKLEDNLKGLLEHTKEVYDTQLVETINSGINDASFSKVSLDDTYTKYGMTFYHELTLPERVDSLMGNAKPVAIKIRNGITKVDHNKKSYKATVITQLDEPKVSIFKRFLSSLSLGNLKYIEGKVLESLPIDPETIQYLLANNGDIYRMTSRFPSEDGRQVYNIYEQRKRKMEISDICPWDGVSIQARYDMRDFFNMEQEGWSHAKTVQEFLDYVTAYVSSAKDKSLPIPRLLGFAEAALNNGDVKSAIKTYNILGINDKPEVKEYLKGRGIIL